MSRAQCGSVTLCRSPGAPDGGCVRKVLGSLTRSERREQRRGWLASLCASGLVHALVVAVLVGVRPEPPRPGPGSLFDAFLAPDDAGGGGGEPMHRVVLVHGDLLASPVPPELPPPLEIAFPEPALPDPMVPPLYAPAAPEAAAVGLAAASRAVDSGSGGGAGGGRGGGTGAGSASGPGAGAGGGGVRPPAPITILMPPPATDAVRGRGAKVLLQVDTMGNVEDVHVVVSSGDSRMDEALRRLARSWRFRPARDAANRAVPYPFEVSVTF